MIPRSWCWPACFPEETGFISRGWVYSSELRVLNTQWIRALLFRFTDSWIAVRVVGNLVLDGWLLGAYRFFVGQLTEKKNWFWYTAPFLLLPFSHEALLCDGGDGILHTASCDFVYDSGSVAVPVPGKDTQEDSPSAPVRADFCVLSGAASVS